jgi:two-component system chemotaxis response regulator CheY
MKKILIVEDQAPMAKILGDILKKDGFDIYTAPNGQIGIDKAKEIKPDLIVTDIMMPIKTGLDLLRELKANLDFAKTPIFVITAKGGNTDMKSAMDAGASGFITKPFSPGQVVDEIKKALA